MKMGYKICLGIACSAIGLGLICSIIVFAAGKGSFEDYGDYHYSYTNEVDQSLVNSLKINIRFGEVNIIEGSSFRVDAVNITKDGVESRIEGNTFVIEDRMNDENSINIFGIKIPIHWFSFGISDNDHTRITITVPQGFELEKFDMSLDAGKLSIDHLIAKRVNLDIAAGEALISDLKITEQSYFDVSAGSLSIRRLDAKNANFDCGVGKIEVRGMITGDGYANCGVGEIYMDLAGRAEDYGWKIDCGIGNIEIDGKSFGGLGRNVVENYKSKQNNLSLSCGTGSITLDFNQ